MDRHSQLSPSKRTIYDLDDLAIHQRSPSPLPAPLDLSCHNRHGSLNNEALNISRVQSSPSKHSEYDQGVSYGYASPGVHESSYHHGMQESVIPTTQQQLNYSQYTYDSANNGLYPYDQKFAYKISSTCNPSTTNSDLYSQSDYHQYRVKSPTSPNPYEEHSIPYPPSQYHSSQLPYSPTHEDSWTRSEAFDNAYSASGMTYHPLTVSTSHLSHTGHEIFVSPQGLYEPVSPRGLVSPTESHHSSYGDYSGQLFSTHSTHEMLGAPGFDPRHSSSDSGVSPEPSSTTIPESLTRYPKGKSRRQKIFHKNLSEEEIVQRKREINNDSSRRHRQRKSLSMKQLEEEEQKELTRQMHLTKTRDMLKQQTELLGSLIKKVDINRK